ncbi:hypothetical protein QQS21_005967 [Conoideocrella luteorostrata]|uniref:Cytochrome P450 n=1 Tax=Conoideocrella luteorostrata TaxID=1105319 RepID=A0AAJ0FYN4_9HYPO|nr:hypothetical protein QQS21_005967 [Conoideocrella luteorostrata]
MAIILSTLAAPQNWPASVLILAITTLTILLTRLLSRPAWPSQAPKPISSWPVFGSLGFFRQRWSFLQKGSTTTPSGQFSFFYGPHSIVALSGTAARKTFFTSRSLDINEGFAALFSAAPSIEHLYEGEGTVNSHFVGLFKHFTHRDRLEANLHNLINDCVPAFENIDISVPIDPFESLYRLVYQLTLRTLGTNDVADDPKLTDETLGIFMTLDDSSALEVMFPGMPFPSKLSKMWAGAKLHMIFSKIMKDRRTTGRVEDDAMQSMMDAGDSDIIISAFIMAALFAGLINTGVNAAWILLFLAKNEEWYQKIRDEVDTSIAKHRYSEDESRATVLSRLTMDDWEKEFPLIDLCLRESIRLTMPGATFRKNIGGKDIKIDNSDEIIPKNTFAVYPVADIHLNPDIYTDPHTWDPSRYLPERAEDQKTGHAYLGWGTGLHPCLGMRFAKLEIAICMAMFFAFFDFDIVDKHGNNAGSAKLPALNHNNISSKRQPGEAWLKCRSRT